MRVYDKPQLTSTVAIFAVDPGTTTGIAQGLFPLDQPTQKEAIAGATDLSSRTIRDQTIAAQIRIIANYWMEFKGRCIRRDLIDPSLVELVCEDWQVRPSTRPSKNVDDPLRLIYGVYGYRMGMADTYERQGLGPAHLGQLILQSPSIAKQYVTDERLKKLGLWIKGRPHERDAFRHLVLRLNLHLEHREH